MQPDTKIRFCCSHCNKAVSVSHEHAGKQGKCPSCGNVVIIPRGQLEALILERQKMLERLETETTNLQAQIEKLKEERLALSSQYEQGRVTLDQLRGEIGSLEENLEDISYGLYRPHFTFETSERYKAAILEVKGRQKEMVRTKTAAVCSTTWTVGDSQREGERMIKQYLKLLLRAFNGEADAAIAKVTWNNYRVMKTRIEKSHEALNKLGTVMNMSISSDYRDLKLEEFRLVFEQEEKRQQEREEQRRIKAQMREEEKVQREWERARQEAEEEEATYERALNEVRKEAAEAVEAEREQFNERIAELERKLQEAHSTRERAIAQAQLTRMGKVYVISNIGSFGEEILKIGMTRRREPVERIRELGDASVPFPFDVHAMIHSENAPELETRIHTHFWERRINRANDRKEFFKVSLHEIEEFAKNEGLNVEFTMLAEAKEYRLTLSDTEQLTKPMAQDGTRSKDAAALPERLFALHE